MPNSNSSAVFAATAILALALGIQDTGGDKTGDSGKKDTAATHLKSSTQLKIDSVQGKTSTQLKIDGVGGKTSTQLKIDDAHKTSQQIKSDRSAHTGAATDH